MGDAWSDRISEYLDGNLSPEEVRALEAHLTTCTSCREILEDLREIVARARHLESAAPDPDLWNRIENEIVRGRTGSAALGSRRIRSLVAALLLVAVGMLLSRWFLGPPSSSVPEPRPGSLFLLVLREDPASFRVLDENERSRVIREYSSWARRLAEEGKLVEGYKLGEETSWRLSREATREYSPGEDGAETLTGYFLIAALAPEEALRIARTCPHLDHGGTIELRKIEG